MEDLVKRIAYGLGGSGGLLMVAAVVSQQFGTRVYFNDGGSANSHASATIVLVSLGLVAWLMALTLLSWAKEQQARVRRDADRDTRRTPES